MHRGMMLKREVRRGVKISGGNFGSGKTGKSGWDDLEARPDRWINFWV